MVRPVKRNGPGSFRLLPWLGIAGGLFLVAPAAFANNGGDPLFCQPQEGVGYLITNSGSDVWTVDPDCFNNFNPSIPVALSGQTPITTTQGGTLTLTATPSGGNYTYTPPSPTFTGVDTFNYTVTTEWNGAGGSGSGPSNNTRPGGPYTFTGIYAIQLNVLPATATMSALTDSGPIEVPVPAGSITGCGAQGNPGLGPPAGTINGCVTRVSDVPPQGTPLSTQPTHGTLTRGGPTGLQYTPTPGYIGPDSFSYYALGACADDGRFARDRHADAARPLRLTGDLGVPAGAGAPSGVTDLCERLEGPGSPGLFRFRVSSWQACLAASAEMRHA